MKLVKVRVKIAKWGNYSKGDILEMHPSTAAACSKVVESADKPVKKKQEPKEDK